MTQTISFDEFEQRTRRFAIDTLDMYLHMKRLASDHPDFVQNLECLYQKYMMDGSKMVNVDTVKLRMDMARKKTGLAEKVFYAYYDVFTQMTSLICDIEETLHGRNGENISYVQKYRFLMEYEGVGVPSDH